MQIDYALKIFLILPKTMLDEGALQSFSPSIADIMKILHKVSILLRVIASIITAVLMLS